MAADEIDYGKYLDKDPTELMVHLEQWVREKTGFDPAKDARTKDEAFSMGIRLCVALRTHHQASPENQERLDRAAEKRDAADAERQKRREARAAAGAKPRGRMPKAATQEAVTAAEEAPKRRGRRKAAAAPAEPAAAATEAPKPAARRKRGAVARAAQATAEAAPQTTEAPKRRGRPRKVAEKAAATVTTEATPANVTPISSATGDKPVRRRRAPRRGGEAAF